jgi:hypothetical protein
MSETDTITVHDGTQVAVDPITDLPGGGARIELDVVDGPRWRLDVPATGQNPEVITSWDSNDELADIDLPDWVDDVLMQLQRV